MSFLSSQSLLPDYVVINDPLAENTDVLRIPTELVQFPLDEATRTVIRHLEAKFDQTENCGGLAAPQIGYSKRIIILAVEDDEELKKYRPDLSDTLPKSIWINPSYSPLSSDKTLDWEACFSVDNLSARIPRYTHISYEAWTPEGEKVSGTAKGYLARLIQHEIDHVDGKLFIDLVPEEEWVTWDEMRKMRDNP